MKFIDVIHSDAGGLGKSEAIGDAGQKLVSLNCLNRLVHDPCFLC